MVPWPDRWIETLYQNWRSVSVDDSQLQHNVGEDMRGGGGRKQSYLTLVHINKIGIDFINTAPENRCTKSQPSPCRIKGSTDPHPSRRHRG